MATPTLNYAQLVAIAHALLFADGFLLRRQLSLVTSTGYGLPHVPILLNLDASILTLLQQPENHFDMRHFHHAYCNTTHCRAGWAIVLAGGAGKKLEDDYGPTVAGALLYAASYPGEPIPDFYTDNMTALADMHRRAAQYAVSQHTPHTEE